MRESEAFSLVESQGFLEELSCEDRQLLQSWGVKKVFPAGSILFRQACAHDTLYLVITGELRAERTSDVSRVTLGHIHPGESIGEMSVLEPVRASATVEVVHDAEVWVISRDRFHAFINEHPHAGVRLLMNLSRQLARRVRLSCDKLMRTWDGRFSFDDDY